MQVNLNARLPDIGRFHVIFLRNVMIYFDTETKRQVVARLVETGVDAGPEPGAEPAVCFHWATPPKSIGRVKAFYGNFGVLVRAYAYLRAHGDTGLAEVTDDAVLAANYLKHRLAASGQFDIPFPGVCKHEFIASAASTSGASSSSRTGSGVILSISFAPALAR